MEVTDLLGTSVSVFIGLTLIVMGFAAYMTGQALANSWSSIRLVLFYCLLIGVGDRFLTYALFEGELLLLSGYLIDTAALMCLALFSYRITTVQKMVDQYPWIYTRNGLFGWRERESERNQ